MIATINVTQLKKRLDEDPKINLIDVRTPGEYSAVHVRDAKNLPLDAITCDGLKSLCNGYSGPIYIICPSGARSAKACQKIVNEGLSGLEIVNVEGGTNAWVKARLPVDRGRGVIALDRQMRITAGSLVLLGVIFGWQVHPGYYGLSAFIGCGLIFSGVTSICPMMNALAMMPWNRSTSPTCNAK